MQPTTRIDFSACTLESLEKTFGLEFLSTADFLKQWLNHPAELTELERLEADGLRNLLADNVFHWNEQKLSLHFIGPLFSLVHYTIVMKMNLFAQRFILADVPDKKGGIITLSGRPDGIIASGYRSPDVPYFSFQRSGVPEYKREKDPDGDPGGQCLAAMLAGQTLNTNTDQSIYGCYVIGQNWYLMVLQGRQYAISPAFSAVTDEVYYILGLLKVLKFRIAAMIDQATHAIISNS